MVGVRRNEKWHIAPRAKWHIFLATGFVCESQGKHASVGGRVHPPLLPPSQALGKLPHLVHTIMKHTSLDFGLEMYKVERMMEI